MRNLPAVLSIIELRLAALAASLTVGAIIYSLMSSFAMTLQSESARGSVRNLDAVPSITLRLAALTASPTAAAIFSSQMSSFAMTLQSESARGRVRNPATVPVIALRLAALAASPMVGAIINCLNVIVRDDSSNPNPRSDLPVMRLHYRAPAGGSVQR